jgi:hypothetical protein
VFNADDETVVCDADAVFQPASSSNSGAAYYARVPASCVGAPAAMAVAASMSYADGTTTWQDEAPSTGYGETVGRVAAKSGYWMLSADGSVHAFGDARADGVQPFGRAGRTAVDLEPSTTHNGLAVLYSDGFIRIWGQQDQLYCRSVQPPPLEPGEQVASLSSTPFGDGCWVFTTKGRVFPTGAAQSYGDLRGDPLNGPVLDSIPTPSGKGYYMVASDGGIFAFGDAKFYGSVGDRHLNAPVQSLVPDPDGTGYWLVASDGGVFAFEAPFRGSMGGTHLNKPMAGMVSFGNGYLMVGEDGGIFNFSDKEFLGSLGGNPPASPIVAVAALDES